MSDPTTPNAAPIDAAPIDQALCGLSELAACDLALAKRFAGRIEACGEAEDDKAMALAGSYQRMARSYRQTLIVQARLRRELKAEARQDQDHAAAERKAAERARGDLIGRRRLRVRRHFERVLWDEYEEDEAQAIYNDFDARLSDLSEDADFMDTPVEAVIARLTTELGLDAEDDEPPAAESAPDGALPISHSPTAADSGEPSPERVSEAPSRPPDPPPFDPYAPP